MRISYNLRNLFTLFLFAPLAVSIGCGGTSGSMQNEDPPHAEDGSGENGGHTHAGHDALFWAQSGIRHEGYVMKLGHHGVHVDAGRDMEPVAAVEQDGKDVADAEVFVSLLDPADQTVWSPEQKTVFEPKSSAEPAHYAQAKLGVPENANKALLRYRIVLPGGGEFTRDVVVPVEKH